MSMYGPARSKIRRHETFSPKGANVNFIQKRDGQKIAVRT